MFSPVTPPVFPPPSVNATRGEEMRVEEFYSNITSFSVRRYDRYTRYRFSLAAKTQVGQGEWHTEESAHYTTEGSRSLLHGDECNRAWCFRMHHGTLGRRCADPHEILT